MSHDILEDRYVGSKYAWHQIGTNLGRLFTSEEAIRLIRADYDVIKNVLYVDDYPIPKYMATVRGDLPLSDPNRHLGIVGEKYQVVQNVQAFSFMDEIMGNDAWYTSAGILGHGEEIFIVAQIDGTFCVKDDLFEQYLTLTNGHTGKHALRCYASPVRVVCRNTLNMSLRNISAGVVLRHTKNIRQRLLDAVEVLGLVQDSFQETQELFLALASKNAASTQFEQFISQLFPVYGENPNVKTLEHWEAVSVLFDADTNSTPGIQHTWYSAAQAAIEYVDHTIPMKNREVESLFGRGARLKKKAIDLAVGFANG